MPWLLEKAQAWEVGGNALHDQVAVKADFFHNHEILLSRQQIPEHYLTKCTSDTYFVSHLWGDWWHPDADGWLMGFLKKHASKNSSATYWIDYCCLPQPQIDPNDVQTLKCVSQRVKLKLSTETLPLAPCESDSDSESETQSDQSMGFSKDVGVRLDSPQHQQPISGLLPTAPDSNDPVAICLSILDSSKKPNPSDFVRCRTPSEDAAFEIGKGKIDGVILCTRFLVAHCPYERDYIYRAWPNFEISSKITQIVANLTSAVIILACWGYASHFAIRYLFGIKNEGPQPFHDLTNPDSSCTSSCPCTSVVWCSDDDDDQAWPNCTTEYFYKANSTSSCTRSQLESSHWYVSMYLLFMTFVCIIVVACGLIAVVYTKSLLIAGCGYRWRALFIPLCFTAAANKKDKLHLFCKFWSRVLTTLSKVTVGLIVAFVAIAVFVILQFVFQICHGRRGGSAITCACFLCISNVIGEWAQIGQIFLAGCGVRFLAF